MPQETPLIYQTEEKRIHGKLRETLLLAREQSFLTPEQIKNLSPEEIQDKIRWFRMWVVTLGSISNQQLFGNKAADFLLEARGVIRTYYLNPDIIATAQEMKVDPEGAEYQGYAEMLRDQGAYFRKALKLTGNASYFLNAISAYHQASQSSDEGSSVNNLALMEEAITYRKFGLPYDFADLTSVYNNVVRLSPHAGGWDRQAVVSWWYIKEACHIHNLAAIRLGLNNLREATYSMGMDWKKKYLAKDIVGQGLTIIRRLTFTQNPHQFEL